MPASEACPCSSLDQAEHAATFASVEIVIERAASKRSSHDYKTNEELLKLVTHAEARLKLDQPQEQETPKHSKLEDRFMLGGQGDLSDDLSPSLEISMMR